MVSSFRYYMKKEILYIDLTVVPYCLLFSIVCVVLGYAFIDRHDISSCRFLGRIGISPAEPSVDLDLEYIENVFTYLER